MIEYIVRDNIDDRVLDRAARLMREGGLVAHPTDTSWHISTAVGAKNGIERLKKLKSGMRDYTLTMIARNINQISKAADLTNPQFKLVNRLTPGPYVFVLQAHRKLEKIVGMKRKEVGVRLPDHPVPLALIETLGEPLWSITASHRMDDQGWWDPEFAEQNLFEGGWELDAIDEIDLILDTGETLPKILTTVLDMRSTEVGVIRYGVGPYD